MSTWTEFDLNAYNARQASAKHRDKPSKGCDDESELHRQIQAECKRRGWMTFHGSMAHSTFRTPGEPDWIICCDEGKVLMVECKTRTGKLSPDQLAIHAWAARLGHTVFTVRSLDDFLSVCRDKQTTKNNDNSTMPEHHHVRD